MRFTICVSAAALFCAASTPVIAKASKHAAFQLNQTTWIYFDKNVKAKARMSIDADGNYIENTVAGKHVDHGTAVMKGDKACFTSKMTKEGEICWTTRPTSIGHSMMTKNDKGEKLKVTRVAYTKLSMPK